MPFLDEQTLLERESLVTLASTISHIVTAHEPLSRIVQRCAESLVWHLDLALARIWLLDEGTDTLQLTASAGISTNLEGRYGRVPVDGPLTISAIARDGRPRLSNQVLDESWVIDAAWAKREGLVAYAGYPLLAQERVIGVMAMFARHALTARTLEELSGIAGAIAQCIRRSQIEDALRRDQERLALAAEGAGMALWDWDVRTDDMLWSPQFFQLVGYDPANTPPSRQAWEACIVPEDRPRVLDDIQLAGREQCRLAHDYRVMRADTGEVVWVAGRGTYVYDEAGTPIRLIGALFNINHRKQAEAEIQRLLDEAKRRQQELRDKQAQLVQTAKLASIGELTTGIAHELNNPLNNIALFVGNALDLLDGRLTQEAIRSLTSSLRAAEEQVHRAAKIINHLRTFGRSGKEEFQPVSINAVAQAALTLLRERVRFAGVDTECRLDPTEPMISGCHIQLEQVLVNLLTNAIDAVRTAADKRILVTTAVVHTHVIVTVTDTGAGIPENHLPRVFDPFFTTKEVGAGTGLGLSIVFGIIKDHHGDIRVDSVEGRGTTFTVSLPLAASERDVTQLS